MAVHPLHYAAIANFQQQDNELQQRFQHNQQQHPQQQFENHQLICCRPEPAAPWRIAIPSNMLDNLVHWFHLVTSHAGMSRLTDTISAHFHHPRLHEAVERIVRSCRHCQQHKNQGRGHGHLPPREALAAPWHEADIDLIGPWHIEINGQELIF